MKVWFDSALKFPLTLKTPSTAKAEGIPNIIMVNAINWRILREVFIPILVHYLRPLITIDDIYIQGSSIVR